MQYGREEEVASLSGDWRGQDSDSSGQAMEPMKFQAVVLLDSGTKQLFPLVSKEIPKALLPVGNRPLLSFSLDMLEACNLTSLHVVVAGETAAEQVSSWIADSYQDRLDVEVTAVPEDSGSADALRSVADRLTSDDVLVVSGDVVTDVALGAVAAVHRLHSAAATMLLYPHGPSSRSPAEDGKGLKPKDKAKGKPPATFFALDASSSYLLFCAHASDGGQQLLIRRALLRAAGQMTVRTDLVDAHIYAFNREVLQAALKAKPGMSSLNEDLLPFLVRSQLGPAAAPFLQRQQQQQEADAAPPGATQGPQMDAASAAVAGEPRQPHALGAPAEPAPAPPSGQRPLAKLLSHAPEAAGFQSGARSCCVHMVGEGHYCSQVNSLDAFGDVNRDVGGDAIHLTGHTMSANNNVVDPSAELGAKTTVGPQCMVGEGTSMAEKCSVKKSLVGRHCRIASGVKIMNSVIMDHVTIAEGCLLQNSVVCSNAHIMRDAVLKDCHVGAGYTIAERAEHKGEMLVKKEKS